MSGCRNSTLRMRHNDATGKLIGDRCLGKISGRFQYDGFWSFKKSSASVVRHELVVELVSTTSKKQSEPVIFVDLGEDWIGVKSEIAKGKKIEWFCMTDSGDYYTEAVLKIGDEVMIVEL